MAIRTIFESQDDPTEVLQVAQSSELVGITITDHDYNAKTGCVLLDPDDIPALIAELRRAAKLAKAAKLAEEASNGASSR